jgi:hypothetical protein
MNWGTGFSACGEGDMGRLSAIGFHAPRFEPFLNCLKSSLQFMRGNGPFGVCGQDRSMIGEGCCGSVRGGGKFSSVWKLWKGSKDATLGHIRFYGEEFGVLLCNLDMGVSAM